MGEKEKTFWMKRPKAKPGWEGELMVHSILRMVEGNGKKKDATGGKEKKEMRSADADERLA